MVCTNIARRRNCDPIKQKDAVMPKALFALALTAVLAGCGGAPSDNATAKAESRSASGWQIKDACATLSKATVEKVLGVKVEKAELSAVRDVPDSYSQCAYTLSDKRMLVFGTGMANAGVTLADQIESERRQVASVTDKAAEPVGGVGKAALWAGDFMQIVAFTGDGRYTRTSLMHILGPTSADESRSQQVAILHAVGM